MRHLLTSSFEQLLTSGSDNRLLVGDDSLNRYGCSPTPRDVVAFGSCTCSSTSTRGAKRAMQTLVRLRLADDPTLAAQHVYGEQRRQLRQLMTIPDDVEIAFTPSGTDVELLALGLVRLKGHRRIVNIVVGPSEVGSGTPLAAAGRHYDCLVPSGERATIGEPVCPDLADQTTVRTVDIRDDQGGMLDEAVIDAMVTEMVSEAVDEGAHVLLHVVAHSKTGMHAPSLDCISRIARNLRDEVSVVIDAAQGRISRQGLREVLGYGYMVMLTGSKFYGGPPFAGCLLVPPAFQPGNGGADMDLWPSGMQHYMTAAEMPESWTAIRGKLSGAINFGAILRWSAALAEIDAYYRVPNADRLAILRAFELDVPSVFAGSESIRMMPVFPPILDPSQTRLLESKTTVFPFRVKIDGRFLDRDELRRWHKQLNRPLGDTDDPGHDPAIGTAFHLGQPVSFRDGSAALRIALGGETIVRIATDVSFGETLALRIERLHDELVMLRRKLEYLAVQARTGAAVTQAGDDRASTIV